MTTKIRTFQRGLSGKGGTYNCGICGRLTRKTVSGQTHLCGQCDEWTMADNAISDGSYDGDPDGLAKCEAEILRLKHAAAKLGGNREALGL